jgi:hypothetical protein
MNEKKTLDPSGSPPEMSSFTVLFARLFWGLVGPFALILLGWQNLRAGNGWLTGLDVAFFAFVALMIAARWADQRSGQATTVQGKPATWTDFQRYAVSLLGIEIERPVRWRRRTKNTGLLAIRRDSVDKALAHAALESFSPVAGLGNSPSFTCLRPATLSTSLGSIFIIPYVPPGHRDSSSHSPPARV